MLTLMKNRRKLCFTISLFNRGQCVGSVPAARRHTAHLDFSSRVIGLIKSSSLPGPTDKCGVGGQTADGCAAQTESAHSDQQHATSNPNITGPFIYAIISESMTNMHIIEI